MASQSQRRFGEGLVCGLAACMLWGLIYIIPLVLSDYDPVYISAGRYASFGVIVLPLLWGSRHELAHYKVADWWMAFKLGLFGNIAYFWALSACVQYAGAALAGMCTALIPVVVAIVANRRDKAKGHFLAWRRLAPGLLLIVIGFGLANMAELRVLIEQGVDSGAHFLLGLLCGVISLLLWTWYPIRNADWLIEHPQRQALAWSTAQGAATVPASLLVYFVYWRYAGGALLGPRPMVFFLVLLATAFLCSWVGIACWNAMSQRLPTALSGQMIVFETIFGVSYAHLFKGEMPEATLVIGILVLIAGVVVSLEAFCSGQKDPSGKA